MLAAAAGADSLAEDCFDDDDAHGGPHVSLKFGVAAGTATTAAAVAPQAAGSPALVLGLGLMLGYLLVAGLRER
jgi:hypothetical protein